MLNLQPPPLTNADCKLSQSGHGLVYGSRLSAFLRPQLPHNLVLS